MVTIPEDADGRVDLKELEKALTRFAARPLKIGSFSAASNVTGIGSDTRGIAPLLAPPGAVGPQQGAGPAPGPSR